MIRLAYFSLFLFLFSFIFLGSAYSSEETNFVSSVNHTLPPLEYINHLRKSVGLSPMTRNSALDKSSKAHALYIINTQNISHNEQKGSVYFTGVSPNDRAKVAGYRSPISEGISYGNFSELANIDNLMSGIYHRFSLLTFQEDEIGFHHLPSGKLSVFVHNNGSSLQEQLCKQSKYDETKYKTFVKLCLFKNILVPEVEYQNAKNKLLSNQPEYVVFPPDSAVDVPPAFFEETPHPLPGSLVSGYPITIQFNPNVKYNPDIVGAHLTKANGQEDISIKIIKQANDPNSILTPHQFAIFPLSRLDYNTSYSLKLELKIKDRLESVIIRFKTVSLPYEVVKVDTKEEITKIKLKENIKYALYLPPKNNLDVIKYLHIKAGYLDTKPDITYDLIDGNTILFMMKNVGADTSISLDLNNGKMIGVIK